MLHGKLVGNLPDIPIERITGNNTAYGLLQVVVIISPVLNILGVYTAKGKIRL